MFAAAIRQQAWRAIHVLFEFLVFEYGGRLFFDVHAQRSFPDTVLRLANEVIGLAYPEGCTHFTESIRDYLGQASSRPAREQHNSSKALRGATVQSENRV